MKSPFPDKKMNITAILACGGNSSRMGSDKSLLVYHQLPQRYHLIELISNFQLNIVLSLNQVQEEKEYPELVITDNEKYLNCGPLTSLLSVSNVVSADHYLLLGCDYPALERTDIASLLNSISDDTDAVCFGNPKQPEPLLCIFSGSMVVRIKNDFPTCNSLSTALKTSRVKYLELPDRLKSIDTLHSYNEFTSQCPQ